MYFYYKKAKMAFWQTALSRVVIPIPVFIIPIGGMSIFKSLGLFPKGNVAGNLFSSGKFQ